MTIVPPTHLVPEATGPKMTWLVWSHIPIWVPSGEQTSVPGVAHEEPVEEPVPGVTGATGAAGAAGAVEPEPDGADEPAEPDEVLPPPGATAGREGLEAGEATGDATGAEAAADGLAEAPP